MLNSHIKSWCCYCFSMQTTQNLTNSYLSVRCEDLDINCVFTKSEVTNLDLFVHIMTQECAAPQELNISLCEPQNNIHWLKLNIVWSATTTTTTTSSKTSTTKTTTTTTNLSYQWPEWDQLLKLGLNNNNKTKTMKTTSTMNHLLLTQFWQNFKVFVTNNNNNNKKQ